MKALDSFKEGHSPYSYDNYTKEIHCKTLTLMLQEM